MTVTVLSKPGCVQCNATYRALGKKGIEYSSTDVTQDEGAYEKAVSLGYRQMPVVLVEQDGELINHWSGLDKEKIEGLAE